ncbi:MAG: hypothetical protein J0I29_08695 [Rhizobiales bacterium]|nr:hypothetical protein [Hyphomicrobiales bacterium]
MFARIVSGALLLGAVMAPAKAENMNADEARKFIAGKLFAFNCFDGTKGIGKILDDGSAQGNIQLGGAGLMRGARLPANTLQVRGQQICASIKGLPFEPCFNLDKNSEVSFRGSVSGLGFAYCDFRKQGNGRVYLARSVSRPRAIHPEPTQSADARAEVKPVQSEPALELRRSSAQ